ncbi:MAG TPA: amino acid ABC transporter permease [Chloroflexota bacterium]|nr:amino acid ABC transporter permease [Chloroflexota bacterium]
MNFDTHFFWQYLFDSGFVHGALVTIVLAVLAQFFGIVLGLIAALMRLSRGPLPILRVIAWVYIWLFRGTPLLVQLAFVYFALPQMTGNAVSLGEFPSALIAFSLNEGAYMAEIVRAGITSVDSGQTEAAHSLGMSGWLTMRRVVLPQAVRFIIPPTGNEFISMLKNTSLAYYVSLQEIFFNTNQLASATYKFFEPFTIVSLYYLAMTTVATFFQSRMERHFERGFSRVVQQPGAMRRAVLAGLHRG